MDVKAFDELCEAGGDLAPHLDFSRSERPNLRLALMDPGHPAHARALERYRAAAADGNERARQALAEFACCGAGAPAGLAENA